MRILRKLALFLVLLGSFEAAATETTYFGLNLSYPSLNVQIDSTHKLSLGSSMAFGFEMWRTIRDLPFAYGVEFNVFSGGAFGSMPLEQTGIELFYFPWSRPASSYSVNDEIVVNSSSWCPYLKFTPGFDFMNFNNTSAGAVYGSESFMAKVAVGLLFPGGSLGHWTLEIAYTTSFNAKDANKSPISVEGYVATAGYSFALP